MVFVVLWPKAAKNRGKYYREAVESVDHFTRKYDEEKVVQRRTASVAARKRKGGGGGEM